MDYVEYVIAQYSDDPSAQPLLNLKRWLRVTRGVSRSWVIGFEHSFISLAAQYSSTSSQASTSQTQSNAHMENVVQRFLSQRSQSFRDTIHNTIVEILWDPQLRDQLGSLSQPSHQIILLVNSFTYFKFLYLEALHIQA